MLKYNLRIYDMRVFIVVSKLFNFLKLNEREML